MWHTVHAVVAWRPTRGNVVWLKVAASQVASENLWQESQVVGKADAMWFPGLVAPL